VIWEATHEDIPALLAYGRAFFDESGYGDYIGFNEEKVADLFARMIDQPDAVILVTEGGFTGAAMVQLYFSSDWLAQELFWWLAPRVRGNGTGALLREGLEDWARQKDVGLFVMSSLDFGRPDQVSAKYRQAGYVPVEHSFVKVM
jgi:GNAT superfamily N-acetyltransferase